MIKLINLCLVLFIGQNEMIFVVLFTIDQAKNVKAFLLEQNLLSLEVIIEFFGMLLDHFASAVNLLEHQFSEVCLCLGEHGHFLQMPFQLSFWLLIRLWKQLRNFGGPSAL